MFLTPDGKPFWGGTYFPKQAALRPARVSCRCWERSTAPGARSADETRAKRRGAEQACRGTAAHARRPAAALERANAARRSPSGIARHDRPGRMAACAARPNSPTRRSCRPLADLARDRRTSHRDAMPFCSLDHMLSGGIYDHIGGGLCRYSTDAEWLVPHFEKMLYDNAQLIRLANWAYRRDRRRIVPRRNRRDGRLAVARDARRRRRACRQPRCRQRRRGGLFYTWTQARSKRCSAPTHRFSSPHYDAGYRAALGRQASIASPPDIRQRAGAACWRRCWPSCWQRASTASRPGATTKCWPTGTAWRSRRSPRPARLFGRDDWLEPRRDAYADSSSDYPDGDRLPHSILGEKAALPGLSTRLCRHGLRRDRTLSGDRRGRLSRRRRSSRGALDRWYGDGEAAALSHRRRTAATFRSAIRGDVDEAIPSATSQIIAANVVWRPQLAADRTRRAERRPTAEAASGRVRTAGLSARPASSMPALLTLQPQSGHRRGPGATPAARRLPHRNPDPRRIDLFLPLGTHRSALGLPRRQPARHPARRPPGCASATAACPPITTRRRSNIAARLERRRFAA